MTHNLAKHSKVASFPVLLLAALGVAGSQATAVADPLPYGPDTCNQGFVWREAFSGDTVCVTPAVRSQAVSDNAAAASRKAANAPAPAAPAAPAPCFQNPAPGLIPDGNGLFC